MARGKNSGKAKKIKFQRRPPSDAANGLIQRLAGTNITETAISTWEELGLSNNLMRGILSYALEKPAICQKNVIRPFMNGRDVICQAQSGMGKTAAFAVATLQNINTTIDCCQALVLSPTRELAEQANEVFDELGKYMSIKCVPCIGGANLSKNKDQLKEGAHIVVGTLGRLVHLMEDGHIDGDHIKMFVIDEADKVLTDGSFRGDMKKLIREISGDAQVFLASATMPSFALDLANEITRNPFRFLVPNDELTLEGIRQFHIKVGTNEQKLETFAELFPLIKSSRGIIFCNTRKGTQYLSSQMLARGHMSPDMVGTMSQGLRKAKLKNFRSGVDPVLIASDLLGRGIDVQHVNLVINYDLPTSKEEYIHRVGRAGRYGRKGVAITFVTEQEQDRFARISEFYNTDIPEMPPNVGRFFY